MSAPRRPWWLAFDRPGHAWWFLAGATFLGVGSMIRSFDGVSWLSSTVGVLLVLVWTGMPIVSLIAYHRRPEWVGRSWERRLMSRPWLHAFATGTAVFLALAVGAGIVAVATSSHLALGAVAIGVVGVLVCGATVAAHDEAASEKVGR